MIKDILKGNFFIGLAIGIVLVGIVAFFVVPKTYSGQTGNELRNEESEENLPKNQADAGLENEESTGVAIEEPIDSGEHVRGSLNAPVEIVEFSDFQCPYCSSFHQTMKRIMNDYPNDVKWVYKHFPLDSIHPYAREAAEASECAAEQSKFWEYADGLFAQQSKIDPSFLKELAGNLGLNVNEFNDCLDSDKYAPKVQADYQEGINSGIRGTPGGSINDRELRGAMPYEQIKAVIEDLLND